MNRNIAVILSANATSFRGQMRMASNAVNDFQRSSDRAAATSARAWAAVKIGVAAAVLAVGVAVGSFIASAAQFETRMRNVNSLVHMTERELAATGSQVLELSRRLPQAANTLAEGLYDITSSGFAGAEALTVLEHAAKAASAGLSTAAVSSRGITAVLNAYGLAASDAEYVSDVLFQTVNYGVVSFEELASNLGDFVGTAAAAKIDIAQAGAALATMTIAGINASEASTALNRTLQAFIDPSDEMRWQLRQIGYESGVTALSTDGLQVVMEKLRVATGGQIETLMQLFPEIRAARGALALMSDEGANYARIAGEITDRQSTAGATARALAEQEKSLSYQFMLVKNNAHAFATELGLRMIPLAGQALAGARRLAGEGWSVLVEASRKLKPAFENVAAATASVWRAFVQIMQAFSPIVTGFAKLAALGVGATFIAIAAAAEAVAGFLEDHVEILIPLVAVWATFKAVAAAQAMWTIIKSGLETVALKAMYAAEGITAATAAMSLMSIALLAVGVGVGIMAVKYLNAQKKQREFKEEVKELTAEFVEQSGVLQVTRQGVADYVEESSRFNEKNQIDDLQRMGLTFGEVADMAQHGAEGWREFLRVAEASGQLEINVRGGDFWLANGERMSAQQYLVAASTEELATATERAANGLGTYIEGNDELLGSFRELMEVTNQANLEAFFNTLGSRDWGGLIGTRELENITEYVTATGDAAGGLGMLGDTARRTGRHLAHSRLAIGQVSQSAFDAAVAASRAEHGFVDWVDVNDRLVAGLAIAAGGMGDVENASGVMSEQTIADIQEMEAATEEFAQKVGETFRGAYDVVSQLGPGIDNLSEDMRRGMLGFDPMAELTEGQQEALDNMELTGERILQWYAIQANDAHTFSTNISAAIQAGYDPNLIARLLQAGPEQAGPLLQSLVDNQEATYVQQVNDAERAIQDLSQRMIEISRLTNRAMTAATDEMAGNLDTAMQIAESKARLGTGATAAAIAAELGVGLPEVERIASQYGIVLVEAINPALVGTGQAPVTYERTYGSGPVRLRADGGIDAPHEAQVARAGDWRVWAEPETGGEAYIPLATGKRQRSTNILAQVASRFGYHLEEYADGGLWGGLHQYIDSTLAALPAAPSYAGVSGFPIQDGGQATSQHGRQAVVDFLTAEKARVPALTEGIGYEAMMVALRSQFPGLALHSGFRPGAITATGNPSYHGKGRAVDVPPRMDVFDWIYSNYFNESRELIFTPAGKRQIRNGAHHLYTGITAKNHWDHVHWAMANGGLLNFRSFDTGGWLQPGLTMAYNGTGSPERVVGPSGAPGGGLVISPGAVQVSVRAEAGVDQSAFEGAVRRAVEPALDQFATTLARSLRRS